MNRTGLYAVILAVVAGLFLYGAVGVWIGVGRAVAGTRTPGTAVDVRCAYTRGTSCGGTFTSDDGTIRDRHVVVDGITRSTARVRGQYVPRISNGLDGAIQSDDTMYVGGVDITIGGSIAIGIVLSVLGLFMALLVLALAFLTGANRLRRR